MTKIVVADTETASIKGPVCDLALIEINEELEVVDTLEVLINPGRKMAPAAQEVHGITDAMVAGAPSMAQFIASGNPFGVAEGEDLFFIAHNAQFDARMLADVLPSNTKKVCTLRMARNLWPDLKDEDENHKLGTLAIMFGLGRGPAHRAMGDAVTCLNLLRHIADTSKVSSFAELMELGRRPLSLESKITFGKHKGMKLKELPTSYVQWICSQQDMDADLREALAPRLK